MSRAQLKAYGPQARRDFIEMVTREAAVYGLTKSNTDPVELSGDTALIQGIAYSKRVARQRWQLEQLVERQGFDQTMEAMAYTWFNRFMAIRYMELHGYLDHGYRVLSHPSGDATPEILQHAERVDLPGLDKQAVIDLKLDGTKDTELYRKLIVAQCNALHGAMPFLFERIDDATELLLPADLLHSESVTRKMVDSIDEADWREVEIVGWLYQFYISEKKDQVIGKMVKSEDIPAATQLFTPNWIVKYMLHNSLGAKWLATYPESPLKSRMEYYIEPAEQDEDVQRQLKDITPESLNPEEITLLDPACGSGHILVEAYELFKAIYQERGYRAKDIPRLVLEKNLYGLEIDERAAQLSSFALLMKARADDRALFSKPVQLNVCCIQESNGLEIDDARLKALFHDAKTYGSLIRVEEDLGFSLADLTSASEAQSDQLFVRGGTEAKDILLRQAKMLARKYDVVVANPPYMGSGYFTRELKRGLKELRYESRRSDLYIAFLDRARSNAKPGGFWSMVTRQDWMHTSSYSDFRGRHLTSSSTFSLLHLGKDTFAELSGEVVQACCMAVRNCVTAAPTRFVDLSDIEGFRKKEFVHESKRQYTVSSRLFPERFGSAFMYRMSANRLNALEFPAIGKQAVLREGIHTGKNELFVRMWWEINSALLSDKCSDIDDVDRSNAKWIPYNKGGSTRRWFFDTDFVIRFDRNSRDEMAKLSGHVRPSKELYFIEGGTWSDVASRGFGVRYFPSGYLFDGAGPVVVDKNVLCLIAIMNSKPFTELAQELMPNLHFKCGTLQKMPYAVVEPERINSIGSKLVDLHRSVCSEIEYQRVFEANPLILVEHAKSPSGTSCASLETIKSSYSAWLDVKSEVISEARTLEQENNQLCIVAYGLTDELTPDVSIEQIALTVNPPYRYGPGKTDEEYESLFRKDTMQELLSYAIGCMMGRYSLDEPGLIYAHSGNQGFDASRYATFPADEDGILPIMELDWFEDDIANRAVEFIATAWPKEHLEENLEFLADSLDRKKTESSRECIRRYLSRDFYKDHLQTYKRRPIYWLFASGKQRAFQCLVYLHRYNEGTLARMRTEYVIPLQSKMTARLEHLKDDIANATSTAQAKRLEKEQDLIRKQQAELLTFDEKLRHYADQRITLDLDDGVKVNYGKFGDLLAEVKAVTGGKAE